MNVVIPANTTAIIKLPYAQVDAVKENGKDLKGNFKNIKLSGKDVELEAGSGSYSFIYPVNF